MACTIALPVINLPLCAAALACYLAITAIGVRWGRFRYLHTEFDVA
jgi:hypothetical protein